MNIEQIRTHIDDLIRKKGKNYRSLSLQIGKNEAYLHQYINKGSPLRLPEEQRRKLAEILDVDEQELTDIKLPKTIFSNAPHTPTALIEMVSFEGKNSPTIGFMSLPLTDFRNMTASDPSSVKMLRVAGDSMSPTLKNGDYVLADFSCNAYSTDGLYLIAGKDYYAIRRVQQISPSELMLISDNANYKPVSLSAKKVDVAAKVVFCFKAEKIG
ncbi:MAG: S24 family peptidase [Alphaproteobacteria bacterium]|nr:S24 family peptidase [Alphaproteobacteria bacterium]